MGVILTYFIIIKELLYFFALLMYFLTHYL